MLGAWCAGYVCRSPLPRSKSLTELVAFETVFLGRCPNPRDVWERVSAGPGYRKYANSVEGRAVLTSNAVARAARWIDDGGHFLGYQVVDVFDFIGPEIVVAGAPVREGVGLLCITRVSPAANILLGAYSASAGGERLPVASGDWWMIVDSGNGLAWTKVGDILAVSDEPALLGQFVASARSPRPDVNPLASALSGGEAPEVALRLPGEPGATGARPSCVVSFRLGSDERSASLSAGGEAPSASFRDVLASCVPEDTSAGAVLKLDLVRAWRFALGLLSEPERDTLWRFVEDRLYAVFDVNDMEKELLPRFTGDAAVVVSHLSDPWMTLASGRSLPTVSLILRVRTDRDFEKRLQYALVEFAGVFTEWDARLAVRVGEEQVEGYRITAVHVRRGNTEAAAGYFVVADEKAPGFSLIVASTSVSWLAQAIRAREGAALRLGTEAWFQKLAQDVSPASPIQVFVHSGRLAQSLSDASPLITAWLKALGPVCAEGWIDDTDTVHLDVRIPGGE